MNLVGYISRDQLFPNPLISVGREADEFFAFYPSGDKVKLGNITSEEMLRARDTFYAVESDTMAPVPTLAFGITSDVIFSGTPPSVAQSIHSYLKSTTMQLSTEDREVIGQFLRTIREASEQITASELQELASGNAILRVFVNRRQLRRRAELALTFLVQLCYKHRQKTLYRKGIPANGLLDCIPIPRQILDVLKHKQILVAA